MILRGCSISGRWLRFTSNILKTMIAVIQQLLKLLREYSQLQKHFRTLTVANSNKSNK